MTITNPNLELAVKRERQSIVREALEDDDFLDAKKGRIKVKRFTKYDDPKRFDRDIESVVRDIATTVVDIDAKLVEGNRIVHYQNAQEFIKSPSIRKKLERARANGLLTKGEQQLAEYSLEKRMLGRTLREGADFELGLYPDEQYAISGKVFPITDVVLPSLNSPQSKNAMFVDYLDSHRKCWEAATFNPIAKRITKIIPQFVLGRGVKGSIDSDEHQKAWDEFYKRNRMRVRTYQALKEIVTFGEIFWRFFQGREGLIVRSIDPSTIWDIVTDEDDIEDVKYYHQQYVRMDTSPVPGHVPVPSTVVIRQIPATEVQHYKINSTSSEKRGRSELFPILGYLLRFKEFVNDRILLNKMRAMFALDVAVEGDAADVASAEEQFAEPPGPAAVLVHNSAVEVEFKNTSANAGDAQTDAETILKVIAIGAGVSENFLGVARAQTRAGALISTEPDVKNFEDYQQLVEEILMDTAERVFKAKRLAPEKAMEFTFPAIAQEDRSAKLKDIALMESMDYFSKERAATMSAREFQITDYIYRTERQKIRQEEGESPVISAPFQQVTKVMPEQGGEVGGLGADLKPNKAQPGGVTQTSAQMGFNKGERALPNTAATLNRPGFTRGSEKLAIQNNRTSGTPLRHSAEGPKRGWSPAAREKSLATRRAKAEQRKREQSGS